MKSLRTIFLFSATWLAAVAAQATTIVMPSDAQLVAKSDAIVIGTVASSEPIERNGRIWTETTLLVEQSLKGAASGTLTVREIGGRLGDRISVIYGAPEFASGERVLVFLTATPRNDYQTTDLFVGKFTERMTRDGKRVWYRRDGSPGARILNNSLQETASSDDVQRLGAEFEHFIRGVAAGDASSPSYLISNPQLRAPLTANFTLIDEPNIYRWFAFDGGTSVSWRNFGQQAGYTGGGLTELETGMAAWSGFSNANIRYRYVGTSGTAGGIHAPNGVNEVLFNDPLKEIAGTWSSSSGGVVGIGGFNGTSAAGNWTGPFHADAAHTNRVYSNTWNITEGNLVIQDGVSPGAGISPYTLSEILAHEFGHTLGFGHTSTNGSLMFPQVTGGGPSLKADDQLAARWLYPGSNGGGGGGGAPLAPTNLTASAVGNARVQLNWTDAATNETMQRIYMATGSAGFVLYAEVSAGAQSYLAQNLQKGQTYSYRVTAVNGSGESAPSNIASLTLPNDVPSASFRVSPTNGVAGQTRFTFTDTSTGPINSHSWSFGDGTTSFEQSPTHVYSEAGLYVVTLTVSNGSLTSSASKNVIVTTPEAPISADFSYLPSNPSLIDNVTFTDDSTGLVSSWSWDFGDQTSSTEPSPVKKFAAAGTYAVKLTVSGNGVSSSKTRNVVITSGSGGMPTVEADFDSSVIAPTTEQTVIFSDRSAGSPNSWYWDFGDGYNSTQQNPSHRFTTAGTYSVSLTAGNVSSSSTKIRQVVVAGPRSTYRSFVPVAADTSGVGGSSWRTELTINNVRNSSTEVSVRYIPQSGLGTRVAAFSLAASETRTFSNVLKDLFSVTNAGGAIAVEATNSSNDPLVTVSSRTFTMSAAGSYGQFVPDTTQKTGTALFLTGLQSSETFRTNIGLVNPTVSAVSVTMTLLDAAGTTRGTRSIVLPGDTFQQTALLDLFPGVAPTSSLSLKIASSIPDALHAYASVVDNRTQDPIYVAALPAASGNEMIVPAVARAAGIGGTFWRSDVVFFNPATSSITLNLTLLKASLDNRNAASRSVTIAAGATLTINDIVTWFGAGDSSGALLVKWTALNGPIISSRTYTETTVGSFGQSIDAYRSSLFGKTPVVTGLRNDAGYRTNMGVVNGSDLTATVTLRARALNGSEVANATITLPPKSQTQASALALFGAAIAELGTFTVTTDSATPVFTYGSVVDNLSGDPIFVAGK